MCVCVIIISSHLILPFWFVIVIPPPKGPCTNARVDTAITNHGKSQTHKASSLAISSTADIVKGLETQASKERNAIKKRMRVVLRMIETNRAFGEFGDELKHSQEMGALDDCPVGNDAGSLFSKSASYNSQTVHRDMMCALADTVYGNFDIISDHP